MIIDVHAHVFAFPKLKGPGAATTFMSAEDQIAVMNTKGVDKAIILPLNNPETPTEQQSIGEVLYICEKYPGRFIPFYNIDPRLPRRPDLIKTDDFSFILEQCKAFGCKGLGEFTARLYWDDPCVLRLLEACEKVGFPVTFHTITAEINNYGVLDEMGLPRLEKVLGTFPNLKLFGHSPGFWSEISGGITPQEKNGYPKTPVKPGGRLQSLMRRYPGLYGDLSAGSGLNALMRDPVHAYEFIDEFQDRLMLGLDYCSVKGDMRHIEWFKAACQAGQISAKAYEKIMWKNINQAIHLGL
ncbi:MAG: amidohydrolase [Verrucomicrobia bacterium]|nr:amidohydrolase [Verrucomicrobiota bacterium]MBU4247010.1 amidohydrolase [Verrucomicrobiota bacterium]MBU4290340.1 amidohydrolase [Verrucomicrobiota bacterium]MBU4429133.1 amidohydrolase [Verrucomicrobiota bacterium]MCG2681761.1 amidohydrolase [Kiritimatiellia bacterium]